VVAVIIDIFEKKFQISNKCFQSWTKNYSNRDDASIEGENNSSNIKHPIQKDSYNCGIFVCLFIEEFITKQSKINLNYT
jgi:Ulp1 family protease